jgi:23S rRNA (adenine1618-N6)-methyltransferase
MPDKPGLHPRNRHRGGYDFVALVRQSPALEPFIRPNPHDGGDTIDFADPAAVTALNRALLQQDYGIRHWEIPAGYLTPPVPGRADYVHHVADLLAESNLGKLPRGPTVRVLDVGIGATCIYPIIGVHDYGWDFVGTEIDPVALDAARTVVSSNPLLRGKVELRRQSTPARIFHGVVSTGERFAASICNPPFHASAAEAAAGTQRKVRNLHGAKNAAAPVVRNFGGRSHELWCEGGELSFVRQMIAESAQQPTIAGWFTTLVAKRDHLPPLQAALRSARTAEVRIIPMAQGQKQSRILAWRF